MTTVGKRAWIIHVFASVQCQGLNAPEEEVRPLRESLFITFRDQCVFLWQQAQCWDT